jgi:Family of unknown function (DUF6496)
MPASEVMRLYREHKLHSGPGGPVVKKKAQATAIQISMARKEGHHIPKPKGSFQHGGTVPSTGSYQVHKGEELVPSPQAQDIAARTRAAESGEWRAAMRQPHAPYDITGGPRPIGDPHYAVEGLKGNVAERMHQQGVKGSFQQGGLVPEEGNYQVHEGEGIVPPPGGMGGSTLGQEAGPEPPKPSRFGFSLGKGGGSGRNPYLEAMQASVNAPLHEVQGFKRGGTIPRTGIYRLHEGERVIPKGLAERYREAKHG